jgi:hypothetical protein
MVEKAYEIVNEELGDWGGPEHEILTERMVTIKARLRSLAGAEPQEGEHPAAK